MKTVKWVHSDGNQAGKTFETLTRLISHLGLPLELKVTYASEDKLTKALEVALDYLKMINHETSVAIKQIEKIKKGE